MSSLQAACATRHASAGQGASPESLDLELSHRPHDTLGIAIASAMKHAGNSMSGFPS